MGIQEYIIGVRMENAKTLLQNGFSVNRTADMVGYHDSFNFSKMFKKLFGISPKQYAQANRKTATR
jgi:AraC-like DNA-binding protein